jgi:hypothetical protein
MIHPTTLVWGLVALAALVAIAKLRARHARPTIAASLIDALVRSYLDGICPVGGTGQYILWQEQVAGGNGLSNPDKDRWLPRRKADEIVRLLRRRGLACVEVVNHRGSTVSDYSVGGRRWKPLRTWWQGAVVLADPRLRQRARAHAHLCEGAGI